MANIFRTFVGGALDGTKRWRDQKITKVPVEEPMLKEPATSQLASDKIQQTEAECKVSSPDLTQESLHVQEDLALAEAMTTTSSTEAEESADEDATPTHRAADAESGETEDAADALAASFAPVGVDAEGVATLLAEEEPHPARAVQLAAEADELATPGAQDSLEQPLGNAPAPESDCPVNSGEASLGAPAEAEPDKICRICLDGEEEDGNPLISPCKCSGSMKHVHRECLNDWRISCFNPKALVGCTTCHAAFRTRYHGSDRDSGIEPDSRRWWGRFARDVAWYLGMRLFAFLGASIAMGFWPRLLIGGGLGILHPNPVVSHLLCGTGTTLAIMGSFVIFQLPGLMHTGDGIRIITDVWCPRRSSGGGGGKGSGMETLLAILIVIGILVCLYYLLKGIYCLFKEGKQEVVRAVRGANQQVRRQVVTDYVVLDLEEAPSNEAPTEKRLDEVDRPPDAKQTSEQGLESDVPN